MTTLQDSELLKRWRDGDRKSGSTLIDRHFRPLRRFFHNKVASESDADDLLQRTFIGCLEGVVRFREDASFRTWMFAVAHNVLRTWFREKRRDACVDFETVSVAELGAGPSTAFAQHREHKLLLEALRRIPFESQVVLELYYWEQLEAKDVSVIMQMPIGTVRSRIRKAKLELQRQARSLAQTGVEADTTIEAMEAWARRVREGWS
ncbi:MAG: RNA polymerase sigma factor [Nannocystaceae bacterium]